MSGSTLVVGIALQYYLSETGLLPAWLARTSIFDQSSQEREHEEDRQATQTY